MLSGGCSCGGCAAISSSKLVRGASILLAGQRALKRGCIPYSVRWLRAGLWLGLGWMSIMFCWWVCLGPWLAGRGCAIVARCPRGQASGQGHTSLWLIGVCCMVPCAVVLLLSAGARLPLWRSCRVPCAAGSRAAVRWLPCRRVSMCRRWQTSAHVFLHCPVVRRAVEWLRALWHRMAPLDAPVSVDARVVLLGDESMWQPVGGGRARPGRGVAAFVEHDSSQLKPFQPGT